MVSNVSYLDGGRIAEMDMTPGITRLARGFVVCKSCSPGGYGEIPMVSDPRPSAWIVFTHAIPPKLVSGWCWDDFGVLL